MARQASYRVTAQLNGIEVSVTRLELKERLSEPFEALVDVYEPLQLNQEPLSFAKLLDQPALITLWDGDKAQRRVHGIIKSLREGKSGRRRRYYQVGVTAALHRLKLSADCRIYQQQTAVEIVQELLRELGLVHQSWDLLQARERREYCVMYNESHYDFVHRLLAEEGIFYRIEHAKTHHQMHFYDAIERSPEGPRLSYREASANATEPGVSAFDYYEQLVTAKTQARDYTFKNPRYSLEHRAVGRELGHQGQGYCWYEYNGRYKFDQQGKPFTRYRQEAAQSGQRRAELTHDYLQVQPGRSLLLAEHPHAAYNRRWYSVANRMLVRQPQSLEEDAVQALITGTPEPERFASEVVLETEVIPQGQAWRVEPWPKPVIEGPQMAHVVGPPHEEIYCDEWGRVKVQFPWDRKGKSDVYSSAWIRVAQNWGGTGWGHMAVPRVGHEVIVDFLEGDPDQPIITGRTYHAVNVPPYELPAHKTRMTIKSKSHKGEGFNELRFEDEKNLEQVYLHAQKDQDIVIENDRREHIRHNRDLKVNQDRTEEVGNDDFSKVERDRTEATGRRYSVSVGDEQAMQVGNSYHLRTGKTQYFQSGRHIVLESGQELTIRSSGGFIKLDAGGITLQGKAVNINSGGSPGNGVAVQANVARSAVLATDGAITEAGAPQAQPAAEVEAEPSVPAAGMSSESLDTSLTERIRAAAESHRPVLPL